MQQVIASVKEGSIGAELGLEKGDILLSIDGQAVDDVLDYYFLCENTSLTLEILTRQHEKVTCEVEKEEDEDLGLAFEEQFMGRYRSCQNHCVFCFIDQLPKGMRPSLYFKDDDARLSFLDGNYITMTNMSDADFDKIIRYHMSPINISVHTTDPDLRVKMLRNDKAGLVLKRLKQLSDAGITMNGQIVLCKGLNDGDNLVKTVTDLAAFYPQMQSVSIVPVGLTKFREHLYPLEPFTKEDCGRVIDQIEPLRESFRSRFGARFVHLSDEFYLTAERDLPPADAYDGYPQIENGVGMMRSFLDDVAKSLEKTPREEIHAHLTLVTAPLAAPLMEKACGWVREKYPGLELEMAVILNHFFGERITVTGLLTGQDIKAQLQGRDLGKAVLLPSNVLKADEPVFLDDMRLDELEAALQTPVIIVQSSGENWVEGILEAGRQKA